MKIAMMQPAFLPWQGFFELIIKSDKFIFLDDFQYSVQSHHTRNKLFVNKNQVDFYSIPVQKSKCFEAKLNEVLIVTNNQWKKKLLRTLEYNYQKAPYFNKIQLSLESILNKDFETLSDLNIEIIKDFCKHLDIEKDFLYSSDFTNQTKSISTRTKRVTELLEWAKADEYLSAFGSFDYMKEDRFNYEKHPVLFQNFKPKPYKQIHSTEFVPYLSVLDALYNVGGEETLNLIKSGTEKFLNWEERQNA